MTNGRTILFADSVGALVPARASAQVHSVFARACNIETDSGELVTVLAAGSGNLPHAIRCASPSHLLHARLRQGQAANIEGMVLRIPAADVVVDFSRAAIWNGTVAPAPPDLQSAGPHRALHELFEMVRSSAPDQGIAPALFSPGNSHSPFERGLVARMAQALPKLARATETRDSGAVVSALGALVGLGAGLTPAGDDFIVGYLAALSSRAYHERGIATMLSTLAVPVGQLALHTHAISRQILLDALGGHFGQCLTEVVSGLCGCGEVTGAALRALEVGHSSGADGLCGMLFGFAPALFAGPIADVAGDPHAARTAALAC